MTRRLCAYTSQAFVVALLLLVGQAEASRDSDKNDAMKAISHHSLLETTKTDSSAAISHHSSAKASVASIAIGTKATLKKTASKASSAKASVASLAIGTKTTLKKTAKKARQEHKCDPNEEDCQEEAHSHEDDNPGPVTDDAAEPQVTDDAAEQTPKALCSVPDDLKPDVALREIEHCVKQLEMIKEGTLEQGKTSWEHNNKYVKSLAGLENRMTELSRPEPFEIAFAVDQADMYEKLKNRLQAIQLDLPKLQGLPGALPEKQDGPKEQDMAEAEEGSQKHDMADVEEGSQGAEEQDMPKEQDDAQREDENLPGTKEVQTQGEPKELDRRTHFGED